METKNSCAVIHPAFLPFVEQCMYDDALNFQGGVLEVTKPRSSTLNYEDGRCCDRFFLEIPYCGIHLSWEVIFDQNHPEHPPDIILSPKDEITHFNPDLEELSSLVNWDPENEQCLVNLLNELLQQYRLHHRELVARNERLSFELNTLLESSEYPKVDVYCSPAQDSLNSEQVTRFFIPLSLDCSVIPAFLTKDNPGPDGAALIAVYSSSSSRPVFSLSISPRIERVLGGSDELRLPPYGGDMTYLMDYVPAVHQLLEERVGAIVQSYVQRKEYAAACLSIMGKAVLEYDTEDFKTLSFCFESQGFTFISRLTLTDNFPTEQPTLVLQSVYHRYRGLPCLSVIKDYPYSPRWNADEMAERIRSYISSVASQFMELSRESGDNV